MNVKEEIAFLILLHNKVKRLVSKVSIKEPLIEIEAMLRDRIKLLRKNRQTT